MNRQRTPLSGKEALGDFRQSGSRIFAVEPEHAAKVEDLANYHHDLVDRLLIAQALIKAMHLITHDSIVA